MKYQRRNQIQIKNSLSSNRCREEWLEKMTEREGINSRIDRETLVGRESSIQIVMFVRLI